MLAGAGPAAAGPPEQDRVTQQPRHRPEVSRRLALLLGHEEIRGTRQRPGDAAPEDGEHGRQRQVDREYVEGAAPVEQPRMAAGGRRLADLPGGQLAVIHHRVGNHPHLVPGRMHTPAEVNVVTEQGQVDVEAADLIPDVPADQHARRADGQHRPAPVMLPLVDLTRLDPGDTPARPVDGDTRLTQYPPVGGVLQLRAEHRDRPAPASHLQQLLESVGGRARSHREAAISTPPAVPGQERSQAPACGPRDAAAPGRSPPRSRSPAPCRRPRPGQAARSAPPRCGPGCRCQPRRRDGRSASAREPPG